MTIHGLAELSGCLFSYLVFFFISRRAKRFVFKLGLQFVGLNQGAFLTCHYFLRKDIYRIFTYFLIQCSL